MFIQAIPSTPSSTK